MKLCFSSHLFTVDQVQNGSPELLLAVRTTHLNLPPQMFNVPI